MIPEITDMSMFPSSHHIATNARTARVNTPNSEIPASPRENNRHAEGSRTREFYRVKSQHAGIRVAAGNSATRFRSGTERTPTPAGGRLREVGA